MIETPGGGGYGDSDEVRSLGSVGLAGGVDLSSDIVCSRSSLLRRFKNVGNNV